jgi:hypothetical protein
MAQALPSFGWWAENQQQAMALTVRSGNTRSMRMRLSWPPPGVTGGHDPPTLVSQALRQ